MTTFDLHDYSFEHALTMQEEYEYYADDDEPNSFVRMFVGSGEDVFLGEYYDQ